MENKKILEFFNDINLLTCAFQYYFNLTADERRFLTFEEIVWKGYAKAMDLPEHKRVVNNLKKETEEDPTFIERLQKTLGIIFHRRDMVSFFRESVNYVNFDNLDQNSRWNSIKDKILKSDPTITEQEYIVLSSVDSETILKMICNSITHEQSEKFLSFINSNRDFYNLNKHLNNSELSGFLTSKFFDEMYSDNFTIVPYRSYRLRRTFQFKIDGATMKDIMVAVSNSLDLELKIDNQQELSDETFISHDVEFVEDENHNNINIDQRVDSDKIINFIRNHNFSFNYQNSSQTITYDENQIRAIVNMFNQVSKNKNAFNFFADKDLKVRENLQDSMNMILQLANIELFKHSILIDKSISYLRTFSYSHSYFSSYELLALGLLEINKFKQAFNYTPSSKNRHLTSIDYVLKTGQERFNSVHFGLSSQNCETMKAINMLNRYALEPKQIYLELLLTQILNLLEYFDSIQDQNQLIWQSLIDSNPLFDEIVSNFSNILNERKGKHSIANILRNSIVHLRYVKDDEQVYFYDGESNIQFKFGVTISQLNEIKNICMNYLSNVLNVQTNLNV